MRKSRTEVKPLSMPARIDASFAELDKLRAKIDEVQAEVQRLRNALVLSPAEAAMRRPRES
jgi:hypothetical protein